ncbi:MAG: HPP family protein [Oceanobacter sp.]
MKTVSELMTRELQTHLPSDSLKDVEDTMAKYHIRHVPVLDEEGVLQGLISQREFLAEAFRITDKFGSHLLPDYLAKTPASKCMKKEPVTVSADLALGEAGQILRDNRGQGCLLVTNEGGHLEGLLTSQDFVRLAVHLLNESPSQA